MSFYYNRDIHVATCQAKILAGFRSFSISRFILALIPVLIFCQAVKPAVLSAAENIIQGKVSLTGKKEYMGKWVVKPGTEIIMQAGASCVFSGDVQFNGSKTKPISITGGNGSVVQFEKCTVTIKHLNFAGAAGIEFYESAANISKSSFSKSKVALKFSKSSTAVLEGVTASENEIGVAVELKAHCVVANSNLIKNGFGIAVSQLGIAEINGGNINHNNSGAVIHQDGAGRITGTRISNNESGIILHRNEGSIISSCTISDNKVGIYAEVYSNLNLADSIISKNGTGIQLVQFCNGRMRGSSFEKNDTAVYLEKKSSPDIRYNSFKDNKTAVFCDFSSYPVITLNNFIANEYHVKLGIYQSADFENSSSSYFLQMQEALSKQSRKAMDFKAKKYAGEVFAKKNFWDQKTISEMERGENVTGIYDGNDMGEVKYEGYGEGKYKIDKVAFRPYLKSPVIKENK